MNERIAKKGSNEQDAGANPVDLHVGTRLRQRRMFLGLTQQNLAKSAGVTFQQIQKYERGANRISASKLFQFSKALNVPISYFFDRYAETGTEQKLPSSLGGFSDTEQETLCDDSRIKSQETLDLIQSYYSVKNPAQRKDLLDIIKRMAANFSTGAE